MAWELDSTFVGRYYTQLEYALSQWEIEQLAIALANDDYERNPRFDRNWVGKNARWHREVSAKWFDGRKGYYLRFCQVDTLVQICIERIERTATTSNGAWEIWIDRDGINTVDSAELDTADKADTEIEVAS